MDHQYNFFVYVVESPSSVDIYHNRKESQFISEAAKLNMMPCVCRTAINKKAFEASFIIGLKEAYQGYKDLLPIIHISCHGNNEGIQLSSNEVISWNELKNILKPINRAFNGLLIVSLSCCEGYSGIRMAMNISENDLDYPFFALIGNGSKPTWAETSIAYATLYHHLNRGHNLYKSADAMNIASDRNDFFLNFAQNIHSGYIQYMKEKEVPESNYERLEESILENNTEEQIENMKSLI